MLTLLLLTSHIAFASTIRICDSYMLAHDPKISITPENPIPGDSYIITTAFSITGLETDIVDGTEELKITLSGFPVVNEKLPLCENVPCPIGNGLYNVSWDGDVPSGVHGALLISENWKMTNGTSILCFSVGYSI